IVGQVGPNTRGVEKMLRAIGFEYAGRIDPFDGGPHFRARTDDVTLVAATRRGRVSAEAATGTAAAIVAMSRAEAPHFRAVGAKIGVAGDGTVILPEAARAALGVGAGDEIGYVAL